MGLSSIGLITALAAAVAVPGRDVSSTPARPPGLELRILQADEGEPVISPANQDGRFDAHTIRTIFAAGPLSASGPWAEPSNPLLLLEGFRTNRHVAIRMEYEIGGGGETLAVARASVEFEQPLDLVQLPVRGGGTATFAVLAGELAWDGRSADETWAADGDYAATLRADLYSYAGELHGSGPVVLTPGWEAVLARSLPLEGTVSVDNTPPELAVNFPPPHGVSDGDSVAVAGTAADAHGAAVSINGEGAPSPEGGAWRSRVALAPGDNEIAIEAEDAVGNRSAAPPRAIRNPGPLLFSATNLSVDRDGNAYLAALDPFAVFRLDRASGLWSIVSGPGRGTGPMFQNPNAAAVDDATGRLFVLDGTFNANAILAIDLATGDRTILSDASHGTGPSLNSCISITLDAAGGRLLLWEDGHRGVLSVDVTTGNRSLLTWYGRGTGPPVSYGLALAYDRRRNQVLVVSPEERVIYSVDLATGNRAVVNGEAGYSTYLLREIVWDEARDRVLVSESSDTSASGMLFTMDLATHGTEVISDDWHGDGPPMFWMSGLALDEARDRALVFDWGVNAVIAVDLGSGGRTRIDGTAVGTGPACSASDSIPAAGGGLISACGATLVRVDPATGNRTLFTGGGGMMPDALSVAPDGPGKYVLAMNYSSGTVVAVNPETGELDMRSAEWVGSGPLFHYALHMVLDSSRDRLVATSLAQRVIFSVDRRSGDRALVSGPGRGTGPAFSSPRGLAVDRLGSTLYVTDRPLGVLVVDPVTGNRRVISGPGTGSGPPLTRPYGVVLDESASRLLVTDTALYSLLAVDPSTGARSIVSGPDRGTGPRVTGSPGLMLDEASGTVIANFGYLLMIDLASGDRVIFSN